MARIPDHEIERLKKEISVERLAEARGIQLTRHGADLVGKCPFHDDRTPSRRRTSGTAWAHATRAGRRSTGSCGPKASASVMRWNFSEPIIFPWRPLRTNP